MVHLYVARVFEEDLRAVWTCAAPTISYDEASNMSRVPPLLYSCWISMWPSVQPSLFLCPALQLYSLTFLYFLMTVRFPGSLPRVYNISGCALHKRLPLNERSWVVYIRCCMSTTSRDLTMTSIREMTIGSIFSLNIFPYVSPVRTPWGILQ